MRRLLRRVRRAPEDQLAAKPATLSFEQAAAVPISGFAALQGLRDVGEVQPGQQVLVIGAAGGGGVVRGPAGQGVRRPGDRGGQHHPAGAGPLDRRRRGDRLHPRRRHRRDPPLGPHHRHRGPPVAVAAAPGPHPQRDAGHRRRRRGRTVDGRLPPQPAGAAAVTVRRPAAADAGLQGAARKTCKPCGSCSRPASSRHASAGPTRWARSPRPCAALEAGHTRGKIVITV